MKKFFLFTICSLFFTTFLFSNITIEGQLVDQDGEGVPDISIQIKIMWAQNDLQDLSIVTDDNGEFNIVFNRPPESRAIVHFKYLDCNGHIHQVELRLLEDEDNLYAKLEYCKNPDEDCKVTVNVIQSNTGERILVATGQGSEPFEFIWSDGSTGETFILPEDGKFCVTMTDADGCTVTLCDEISDPKDCRVRIVRLSSPNNLIGFKLSAQYLPASHGVKFLWNTGDTTQNIIPGSPGRYCVKIIFPDGCIAENCVWIGGDNSGQDPDCIIKAQVSVKYAPDFSSADLTVQYNPAQNLEFLWSTGETGPHITVTESGIYNVVITDLDNNCRIIRHVFIQLENCTVEIVVRATSSGWILTAVTPFDNSTLISYLWSTGETGPSILVTDPDREYCVNIRTQNCRARACIIPANAARDIIITQSVIGNNEFVVFNAGSVSGEEVDLFWSNGYYSPHMVTDKNGEWEVTAVFPDGEIIQKTVIAEQLTNKPTDLNSEKNELTIMVYPNPTDGKINVRTNNTWESDAILTITDLLGRLVYRTTAESMSARNGVKNLDISNLGSGTYILTVQDGNQSAQSRVLIH